MSSPLCRHRNDFASHLPYYMLPTTTSSVSGTKHHHHLYMPKLCRVFVPKASALFVYFSLRYRPRKIMRCFLLNETNQNKAVAMRTTHIVRQGLAPVKISLFLVVTERNNAAIQLFK